MYHKILLRTIDVNRVNNTDHLRRGLIRLAIGLPNKGTKKRRLAGTRRSTNITKKHVPCDFALLPVLLPRLQELLGDEFAEEHRVADDATRHEIEQPLDDDARHLLAERVVRA